MLFCRVGDVITNVERLEGGWWRGRLRGEVGMFPDNFVKVGDSSASVSDQDPYWIRIQLASDPDTEGRNKTVKTGY
jgi:Variant SH3 domain